MLALLQIAQTYLVYLIGDDANHSMPSIRRFVAQEYKQRGLELDTVKAAEPKESDMAKEPVVAAGEKSVVVVPARRAEATVAPTLWVRAAPALPASLSMKEMISPDGEAQ